jgi:hypothetical protein
MRLIFYILRLIFYILKNILKITFIASIITSMTSNALFNGLAKTTEAVTKPVVKTTETLVPPATPIVKAPIKVVTGTLESISSALEEAKFNIINKQDTPVQIEIRKENNALIKRKILDKNQSLTLPYIPAIVLVSCPAIKGSITGYLFNHEAFKKNSVSLEVIIVRNKIYLKPQKDKKTNISRKEIGKAKRKYQKWEQ